MLPPQGKPEVVVLLFFELRVSAVMVAARIPTQRGWRRGATSTDLADL